MFTMTCPRCSEEIDVNVLDGPEFEPVEFCCQELTEDEMEAAFKAWRFEQADAMDFTEADR